MPPKRAPQRGRPGQPPQGASLRQENAELREALRRATEMVDILTAELAMARQAADRAQGGKCVCELLKYAERLSVRIRDHLGLPIDEAHRRAFAITGLQGELTLVPVKDASGPR